MIYGKVQIQAKQIQANSMEFALNRKYQLREIRWRDCK